MTWAGAGRIENLLLVATPNSGSVPFLDAILNGSRVGFSSTTLSASVIAGMPSVFQLLPRPRLPASSTRGASLSPPICTFPASGGSGASDPTGPHRRNADPEASDPASNRAFLEAAPPASPGFPQEPRRPVKR